MQYRKFGKLDWKASILGLGCMRLPTHDGIPISANINEEEAIKLIHHAIEKGVNFLDSAYTYHEGNSEVLLGKALQGGYRDKIKLSTKCPIWLVEKPEDFDTYLDEQLERSKQEHVEFYLFHGLNRKRWRSVLEMDLLGRAEAAIASGKIGGIGFSFHDNHESFQEIIDGYDRWVLCLIQYNYMDVESQAGTKGLQYAAAKGVPVVIMEPLLGGNLAHPPQKVQEIFDTYEERRSPAEWALRWLWDHPEVNVVLSGMRSMRQLEENMRAADASGAHAMGAKEKEIIERVRDTFMEKALIPCTGCGYCLPCPTGVNIPDNFRLYNDGIMYDDLMTPRFRYFRFFDEEERAHACTACGECEEKCPQEIFVSELMPEVHAVLGEGKPYGGKS